MHELSKNIAVNQIGYDILGGKSFWVTVKAAKFNVVCEETGGIVFSGDVSNVGVDASIGTTAGWGDFSPLKEKGRYYIEIDHEKSYSFEIGEDVFASLRKSLIKMIYYQRCGVELDAKHAGEEYTHKPCHLEMGKIWGEDGEWNGTGGWHDAGDYGKYSVPCVRTIADLLFAYELYPDTFGDDINIPESGNGVPDILDEAKVGLLWLLKMQRKDGGVYHKFTSAEFCGMIMPEDDLLPQYAIQVSPTATAGLSAVMAKAARIFGNIDKQFARRCKKAAILAWEYMKAHPDMPQYENPQGVVTGEYKDTSNQDELYWAAVELYILSGESIYLAKAESLYSKHIALFWTDTLEWYDVGYLGTFSYLLFENVEKESVFYKKLKKDTIETADKLVAFAGKKAYSVAMNEEDYIWGSNMVLTNRANVLLMAYEIEPKMKYIETAQSHMDYLLGTNALSQCFVTGFGEKTIKHPHHRPSAANEAQEPIPGMVSGGPNSNRQDAVAQESFDEFTPPAMCFIDDTDAYSLNEVATYWNSSALLLVAGLTYHK